jgi:hypothetical protein
LVEDNTILGAKENGTPDKNYWSLNLSNEKTIKYQKDQNATEARGRATRGFKTTFAS